MCPSVSSSWRCCWVSSRASTWRRCEPADMKWWIASMSWVSCAVRVAARAAGGRSDLAWHHCRNRNTRVCSQEGWTQSSPSASFEGDSPLRNSPTRFRRLFASLRVSRYRASEGRGAAGAPLGEALAREIDEQRRHAVGLRDGFANDVELRRPALEEKRDEGELALPELVRIGETHQQRARIRDAGRGIVDAAVLVVLDRLFRRAELVGDRVDLVERPPVLRRYLAIGAVVVKHLEAGVGGEALCQQRRLRAHGRISLDGCLQAAQVAQAHLLPELDRVLERGRFGLGQRQRAVREALGLLELDETDRL